ncbi:MAG: hypothetical protein KDC28_06260 [Saprospiraceae bacterium]|nr:hypothetical protein [Saprospiraceae bacterium]MCB9321219.1 hypothetical protein [Lewinellaceae bacterium]
MESILDLFRFIKERKKYWLIPIIVILLLLGLFIVIGGSGPLAPFIYSIF